MIQYPKNHNHFLGVEGEPGDVIGTNRPAGLGVLNVGNGPQLNEGAAAEVGAAPGVRLSGTDWCLRCPPAPLRPEDVDNVPGLNVSSSVGSLNSGNASAVIAVAGSPKSEPCRGVWNANAPFEGTGF